MKKTLARQTIGIGEVDQAAIGEGVSQAALAVILTMAALLGTWGLACLVSGVSRMGGVLELARAWLSAVTGA